MARARSVERAVHAPPPARAVRTGSFESIYRAHAGFVFQVLVRLGVSRSDAEDVCQEVFAIVHAKLASFAGRSALRTWIYGIAFRAASEHRRRAWVRRERPMDVDPGVDDGTPLEKLAAKQARAVLERILASLDDEKRSVFVFYEIEQLPMSEVAEIVGCPLQTAYSRLHAARDSVQDAIVRLRAKEGRP